MFALCMWNYLANHSPYWLCGLTKSNSVTISYTNPFLISQILETTCSLLNSTTAHPFYVEFYKNLWTWEKQPNNWVSDGHIPYVGCILGLTCVNEPPRCAFAELFGLVRQSHLHDSGDVSGRRLDPDGVWRNQLNLDRKKKWEKMNGLQCYGSYSPTVY